MNKWTNERMCTWCSNCDGDLRVIKTKHTGNKRFFLDKTVWWRWRRIHCVCCLNLNDMIFANMLLVFLSGVNCRCWFWKLVTWVLNKNGKKRWLEFWLPVAVFIAFEQFKILEWHDHNSRWMESEPSELNFTIYALEKKNEEKWVCFI